MLPPFVPPSARVPSESLPLITEFVIDRSEHAGATATIQAPTDASNAPDDATGEPTASAAMTPPRTWTNEDVNALPSIDDFLMERPRASSAEAPEPQAPEAQAKEAVEPHEAEASSPSAAPADTEAMRPADVPAAGIAPATLEREEGEPTPPAETEIIPTAMSADAGEVKESVPPGARFNDEAADTMAEAPGMTVSEAWEASAVTPDVAGAESAHASAEHDEWGTLSGEGVSDESGKAAEQGDAAWVSEERDAYDWQSVATIAAGPDEVRRASEEWEGTEWEPRRAPEQEKVATALVQLARRIRAGEVKVDVPPNATVEASLAALLAALLTEGDR